MRLLRRALQWRIGNGISFLQSISCMRLSSLNHYLFRHYVTAKHEAVFSSMSLLTSSHHNSLRHYVTARHEAVSWLGVLCSTKALKFIPALRHGEARGSHLMYEPASQSLAVTFRLVQNLRCYLELHCANKWYYPSFTKRCTYFVFSTYIFKKYTPLGNSLISRVASKFPFDFLTFSDLSTLPLASCISSVISGLITS